MMNDDKNEKVLIVDDSVLVQARLKEKLMKENEKINIKHALNCSEALELFHSFRPDKIILDISLPDGSGIDLLKKFKEDDPMVKVSIFTNYSNSEFKKKCMDLNADHFYDKTDLLTLIGSII